MNANYLFIKELKFLIESGFILNKKLVDELQNEFDKSPGLITQLYHLLAEHRRILHLIDDMEVFVYDYMINKEIKRGKTIYGAITSVAEMFQIPKTYVTYKVNQCGYQYVSITA